MKTLNQRAVNFPSKTDWNLHEDGRKLENWWEYIGENGAGNGTLKQELQDMIDVGIEEYNIQQQEDLEDFNEIIKEGL